jgi:hypothetical protein
MVGLTEPEISELKELKKSLNDLCYTIFDIIENSSFVIEKEHKKELRDFIDDTLLWICSHDKPTKLDYKVKIDEINEACDKIIKVYEEKNTEIFRDKYLEIKTKLDELENLCLTVKVLIDSGTIPIKNLLLTELENKIVKYLDDIYNDVYNDLSDNVLQDKIDEINLLSNNLFNKLQGLNITSSNTSHINENTNNDNINNNTNNNTNNDTNDNKDINEGTSIQDLLRQRQEIEINTILVDNLQDLPSIDDALNELKE